MRMFAVPGVGEVTVDLECTFAEYGLECSDELTAKDTAEHVDGKEEVSG